MARLTTNTKWRRMLAWLRREFPLQRPVTVRRLRLLGDECGTCVLERQRFRLEIASNQCSTLQRDSLLHEWAHAMTWFGADAVRQFHGPEWGLAYAKLYRRFLVWNYGRKAKSDG